MCCTVPGKARCGGARESTATSTSGEPKLNPRPKMMKDTIKIFMIGSLSRGGKGTRSARSIEGVFMVVMDCGGGM